MPSGKRLGDGLDHFREGRQAFRDEARSHHSPPRKRGEHGPPARQAMTPVVAVAGIVFDPEGRVLLVDKAGG